MTNNKKNFSFSNKTAEQFKIIEYPLIILFVISGGTFLMCSNDLITIFLAIELQSYGLYLLCSIYRNSELATNAGLTYFLLGGLSSCIILLGQSLLYINSGNTSLDAIYIINSIFVNNIESENILGNASLNPNFLHLSMLILSTGFLFKVSAAPFHFWSPDVYDAIPTIVTTFVAIIAKITILIFLLQLVYYTSSTIFI
jgi:NADH-ubiquinone oxidoreductase chain 2